MNTRDDIVYLSRDSFARLDYIRICEPTNESCAWCGKIRPSGKLFYYGSEDDNCHSYFHPKGFCCKHCHDIYYL